MKLSQHTSLPLVPEQRRKRSASQVSTALACNRKWGWNYIVGVPSITHPSAALGSDTHSQLENYLRTRLGFDFSRPSGEIAASGIEHLPRPMQDHMLIEEHFQFEGRHLWHGYKDIETHDTIYDHKTTSDLKWAKTEEELEWDVQRVLYAEDYFRKHPDRDVVKTKWVYYQTKGTRRSKPVEFLAGRAETKEKFDEIERIADELDAIQNRAAELDGDAKRAYILTLPYDSGQCEAYGGCPYRGLCNLSPNERFAGAMTQANNSLQARLAARANGTPPISAADPTADVVNGRQLEMPKHLQDPEPVRVNPPETSVPPTAAELEAKRKEDKATRDAEKAASKAALKAEKEAAKAAGKAPPETAPAVETPQIKAFILFIDCVPIAVKGVGATPPYVEGLYAEAKKRLQEQHGLSDYRFKGFGEGQGMFVQTVTQILDEHTPESLVVNSQTPETQLCMALFMSRATAVVQGIR